MTNFLDTLAETIETILMEDASDEAIAKLAKAVADHAARFPRSHVGVRKQRFTRHVIDAIDSAHRYRNPERAEQTPCGQFVAHPGVRCTLPRGHSGTCANVREVPID